MEGQSGWGSNGGCCGGVEAALGGGLLVKVKSPLWMAAVASPSAAAGRGLLRVTAVA